MRSLHPKGLDALFEVVDPAASFSGYSMRAATLRAEKVAAGIDIDTAARVVRVPVTELVAVLAARRAWRTPEAYAVAGDRLRSERRRRDARRVIPGS